MTDGASGNAGGMRLAAEALELRLRGRPVLAGVHLVAEPGRLIAVVGPNGAGKSSLLRLLAGIAEPSAGSVSLDGRSLANWERRTLARAIAYLPQERLVHWSLSVAAVVALGRLPHGDRAPAVIERALAAMDIAGLAGRPATELSGGELARVLLARTLAQEARILIADEPTAGLDPGHQLALFGHLRRLAASGHCIIVALHDLSLAARFCHEAVLLRDGRVVASGPTATVLTPARIVAAYGVTAHCTEIVGIPVIVPVAQV